MEIKLAEQCPSPPDLARARALGRVYMLLAELGAKMRERQEQTKDDSVNETCVAQCCEEAAGG